MSLSRDLLPARVRENVLRLMTTRSLSNHALAEQAGVDERTIRGILSGDSKPHIRTLHQLADGLGVSVDELFLEPAQLLYRRFDAQTNPSVAEALETHRELFADWSEADFAELHSHVGAGGALTCAGAVAMAEKINRKRDLHGKLDLLLETSHAELIGGIVDLLYKKMMICE